MLEDLSTVSVMINKCKRSNEGIIQKEKWRIYTWSCGVRLVDGLGRQKIGKFQDEPIFREGISEG